MWKKGKQSNVMAYTASNPNRSNHEWFEELCAAAAIGELASAEFTELQTHLAACDRCRAVYADFCKLSSEGLSILAVSGDKSGEAPQLDEERLISDCLRRASAAPVSGRQPVVHVRKRSWFKNWHASPFTRTQWAMAVTLVIALGMGWAGYIYRSRQAELESSRMQRKIATLETLSQSEKSNDQQTVKRLSSELANTSDARNQLDKQLQEANVRSEGIRRRITELESALSAVTEREDQQERELQAAANAHEEDVRARLQLQADLQSAREQLGQQQQLVADLNGRLQHHEPAEVSKIETTDQTGMASADARQLFGARDLHIVDVYDVDGNGKSQRTYGRVYYVEKKLLLFYAFDLQDKKRNRMAAGFQAWGYEQAGSAKPQNLGLFYVDDSSTNRWALKVDNPRVLQRIDAVFVTLEPPQGSPVPRGRRLLYANLGGPPNHP